MTSNYKSGLASLADCPLSSSEEAELVRWEARGRGSPVWRKRKIVELRELMALSRIAPRLKIEMIDAVTDLRAVLRLRCPVPCLADTASELRIADEAVLGLTYTEEALRSPQPGYAFVQILEPRDVFMAVVARGGPQLLCLGTTLPVGFPVREIVLATYGALTMQNVHIDERDPAGVMNAEAALWWQQRTSMLPLSDVPFLSNADLSPEVSS